MERSTTSLNFVGNKVICVCVQVRVSCAADTYLSSLESYWRQTLLSLLREICCFATSRLSLGAHQRRARRLQLSTLAPSDVIDRISEQSSIADKGNAIRRNVQSVL